MSDIVLSAGVRQNLLALQNTAKLMTITQNRLATGNKVNTALDNPVNFFTASGLKTRAGDLSALLDAMSNGVKTLQAADNGLTSITNTLNSMQSTLLQARQDKSYKTQAYGLGTINNSSLKYLSLSGGSVGTNPVQIALQTNTGGTPVPATAAALAGSAMTPMDFTNVAALPGVITNNAFTGPMSFADVAATAGVLTGTGNFTDVDVSGGAKSFTIDLLDGNGPHTINLPQGGGSGAGNNHYTVANLQSVIDAALGAGKVTVGGGGGSAPITLTTVGTGYNNGAIQVGGANITDLGLTSGDTAHGLDAVTPVITFNVAVDGGAPTTVTINKAQVQAVGNNDTTLDDINELKTIIDNQLGNNVTVGITGGNKITLTSATSGASSSVAVTSYALNGVTAHPAAAFTDKTGILTTNQTGNGAAGKTPTLNFTVQIDGGIPQVVTINQAAVAAVGNNNTIIDNVTELRDILRAQLNSSVTVNNNGSGGVTFTSATSGAGSSIMISGLSATDVTNNSGLSNNTSATGTAATLTGGTNVVKTIDQIVDDINNNAGLTNRVRASNDNGKLRIENLATGALTVTGIDSSGNIDGGVGTSTIGGNQVRANLANQFNELRDQLNKIAGDSSFNGVNLLNGDVLKVTFNETGTSALNIQAKDQAGNAFAFTAINLNIASLLPSSLDFDSSIDGFLNGVNQAINTTRSQASNFGSYLSIVENRQDFTKAMINTLQTGADNLTLADTNEEGANMLALQTRQQLSTTALSLAAQADQGVLRLFG